MYILSDGKNYVMENPLKQGTYLSTTSPIQAKEFTWKQARVLLNDRSKKMSWIKGFHVINKEDGQPCKTSTNYRGNEGAFIGDNDFEFDEIIIENIYEESKSIIGLAGWNMEQLKAYEEELRKGLSKYDSAESDINHALERYKEANNGKKPQAHKMSKIGYLLADVRDKHKHIKQSLSYIKVFKDAITYEYTIEKIKIELLKARHAEYKGRTEYYKRALELLDCEVD